MKHLRDDHGRVCCGTTPVQDVGYFIGLPLVLIVVLISLLFHPPSKRVGSDTSWT